MKIALMAFVTSNRSIAFVNRVTIRRKTNASRIVPQDVRPIQLASKTVIIVAAMKVILKTLSLNAHQSVVWIVAKQAIVLNQTYVRVKVAMRIQTMVVCQYVRKDVANMSIAAHLTTVYVTMVMQGILKANVTPSVVWIAARPLFALHPTIVPVTLVS